jgi:uncharacterized protein
MLGQLDPQEIETLLQTELIGRLGCHAGLRTYIVPITYAYSDNSIYARTTDGLKLQMMRKNPAVCFQVDHIDDLANWKSVVVWGSYEELDGAEAGHAMATLLGKMLPRTISAQATQTTKTLTRQNRARTENLPAVIFCIRIAEKTGRFEVSENNA